MTQTATRRTYGPYLARVERVHDADTIELTLDLGFGVLFSSKNLRGKTEVTCRVEGIDAPEEWTGPGVSATEYARTILHKGDLVEVLSYGWDKYKGRYDGSIQLGDGRDYATVIKDAGHAHDYDGGPRSEEFR
jgi:endonuclease YncB( thermonuclease family)